MFGTVYQDIFALFFAILYGVMLSLFTGYGPFPYHRLLKLSKKDHCTFDIYKGLSKEEMLDECKDLSEKKMLNCKRRRIVLSFVVLNFVPFSYFIVIFYWGLGWSKGFGIDDVQMSFVSILFALSVFGVYRMYKCLIIWRKDYFFCDMWTNRSKWLMEKGDEVLECCAMVLYFGLPWIFVFIFVCFPYSLFYIMIIISIIVLTYEFWKIW